ncbi:MAG TPA: hypothetical protein VK875_03380 [Euzebyales bacterium]|nr:hypothetical protein [Euzebyales bacterium]
MSRTTTLILRRPTAPLVAVVVLLLAMIATVTWQAVSTAGTDGTAMGQRAAIVESVPVAPLRQLERAEQARAAGLGRVGRSVPVWLLPRPDAALAEREAFLSELRRDRARASGPTFALDQQIAQFEAMIFRMRLGRNERRPAL